LSNFRQLLKIPDLAGIDHLSFDKRAFDPSTQDIKAVCGFFALGQLRHFEKEKGIAVSHSNFLVMAVTSQGRFALKFYPKDAARSISIEYAANRFLTSHDFLTPAMRMGRTGKPFFESNGRLAACYDHVDGAPAWQKAREASTFRRINSALLALKQVLSAGAKRLPLPKQASLLSTANALVQDSRRLAPYDHKKIIDASLRDACKMYQHHRALFTRQKLHNNASLTNFIISKNKVHTLDLSHLKEDHILADLASLLISCLFFGIPLKTIKAIAKDYFSRHAMGPEHSPVLNTIIKTGLIREYLKNIEREKLLGNSKEPAATVRTYAKYLSKRKRSIAAFLKKINANPGLIV
jgi:Ser/Thr protein kinase RdoA (MazF antagonist)